MHSTTLSLSGIGALKSRVLNPGVFTSSTIDPPILSKYSLKPKFCFIINKHTNNVIMWDTKKKREREKDKRNKHCR